MSKNQEGKSPLIFDRPTFYEYQFEGQISFYKETYVSQYEKNTFLDKIKSQTQDSEKKKCLDKYLVSDISIDIDNEKFFLIKEIESIVKY